MNRKWVWSAVLVLCGCITGSADTFAGATVVTTEAIGAAIAERKAGGCIAICTGDTLCNPRNGLCEVRPCRNACGEGQHCEETMTGAICADGAVNSVSARAASSTQLPIAPMTAPQPAGAPTVVPANEQTGR